MCCLVGKVCKFCHTAVLYVAGFVTEILMAFVALPPTTKSGCVVFGKNTNRPKLEVQEVVYYAAKQHQPNSTVDVSAHYHFFSIAVNFLCYVM